MAKYLKSGALAEDTIQRQFFDWIYLQEKNCLPLTLFHHVPNGGSRNVIEAKKFKAMGTRSGIPDTFLPVPKRGFHGLFIEFKSQTGSLSPEQDRIINQLLLSNYAVFVCRDSLKAIQITKWYLNIK